MIDPHTPVTLQEAEQRAEDAECALNDARRRGARGAESNTLSLAYEDALAALANVHVALSAAADP